MYVLPFDNFSLSTTPGTFKTLAAIIVPATVVTGRIQVRRVHIVPTDAAALDRAITARLIRAVTTAGTPGTAITAAAMPRRDLASRDPAVTGGIEYSAEPTGFATYPIWVSGSNDRGIIDDWFLYPSDFPTMAGATVALLCLQATVRASDATASKVSGFLQFTEDKGVAG